MRRFLARLIPMTLFGFATGRTCAGGSLRKGDPIFCTDIRCPPLAWLLKTISLSRPLLETRTFRHDSRPSYTCWNGERLLRRRSESFGAEGESDDGDSEP